MRLTLGHAEPITRVVHQDRLDSVELVLRLAMEQASIR